MVLTDVRNLLFYWDLFSGVETLHRKDQIFHS